MANNTKQTETVIAMGATAFRAGQAVSACPYIVLSKQGQKFAKLWRLGWYEAQSMQMRDLLTPSELERAQVSK
jgi:hypothetical protein